MEAEPRRANSRWRMGEPSDAHAHLARRLEGFGDVVFGFAIGQLALQLAVPATARDLYARPVTYALYFGTFAALAALWITYHRVLTGGFVPERPDLILAFAYLAFVGLVPYSLSANIRFGGQPDASRLGFAAYLVCALGTFASATALYERNLRRSRAAPPATRAERRSRALTGRAVTAAVSLTLAVDLAYGAQTAAPVAALIVLAAAATRRLTRETPLAAGGS